MRFSLKDVRADVQSHDRTYGPPYHSGCTASSLNVWPKCGRETLFLLAVPLLMFRYYRVVLVAIELIIGLLSIFGVMEPQGNYMEELYGPGEYKLT
jgi:hypothetical protein